MTNEIREVSPAYGEKRHEPSISRASRPGAPGMKTSAHKGLLACVGWLLTFAQAHAGEAPMAGAFPKGNASLLDRKNDDGEARAPYDLSEAVREALARRLEVGVARTGVDRTTAKIAEMKGRFLPTVNLQAETRTTKTYDEFSGYNAVVDVGIDSVSVPINFNPMRDTAKSGLYIDWNIYDGGRDNANLMASQAEGRDAVAAVLSAKKKLTLEVIHAYLALYKEYLQYGIAGNDLQLAQSRARLAQIQYEKGDTSARDQDEADLALVKADLDRKKALRRLDSRNRDYCAAMGFSSSGVEVPLANLASMKFDMVVLEEDIKTLLNVENLDRFQPDLLSAQAKIDMAEANRLANYSNFYPSLNVSVGLLQVGRSNSGQASALTNIHRDSAYVGLVLKWNIFDGFRTTTQVAQADADLSNARLSLELQRTRLKSQIDRNRMNLDDALDILSLAQKEHLIAERHVKMAEKEYGVQGISMVEYLSARNDYENSRIKYTIADVEVNLARIDHMLSRPPDK